MKKRLTFILCAMTLIGSISAQTTCRGPRKMWASINALSNTTTSGSDNLAANGKLLLTWRMLPTDSWDTSFYIFSRPTATPNGILTRKSSEPIINSTCFQIATPPTAKTTYYLISGDKTVDISDIVAVINSIAGTQIYPLSDVNGDNATDISDVVAVINIIAGQ